MAAAVGVDPLTLADLLRAANTPGFHRWQEQVRRTGGCSDPVQLMGSTVTRDTKTGDTLYSYSSWSRTRAVAAVFVMRLGSRLTLRGALKVVLSKELARSQTDAADDLVVRLLLRPRSGGRAGGRPGARRWTASHGAWQCT